MTAQNFVDDHLTPLLKAADEINGKLRSLSEDHFKALCKRPTEDLLCNHDMASLLFLFGKFWSQIEIIRRDGMSLVMGRNRQGARLQAFFDCLESRRVRIIERIMQRAIGEAFIKDKGTLSFVEFVSAYKTQGDVAKWMEPLAQFLLRMRHTSERQKLLQYGAVIHAMIDNLDAKHLITRERPA